MNVLVVDTLAFFTVPGGFTGLLLAMSRHRQDWLGRKLPPAKGRAIRRTGTRLLAVNMGLACAGHGRGYGLILGVGSWSVSAAFLVAANCTRMRIVDLWKG
ncbi:DUF3325 domain-containing protein (plasmid) [Novosphingobium sp. BL-8A]|uniref:DUF3325 domain-containing protein n=1 Tax=Novosphingobium sp. BL-8A TaxID=3127639 RepID=UPI0037583B6C